MLEKRAAVMAKPPIKTLAGLKERGLLLVSASANSFHGEGHSRQEW